MARFRCWWADPAKLRSKRPIEDAAGRRRTRDNEAVTDQIKPAYLIHGSDVAKVDLARSRLRDRALTEGGDAAIEIFEPAEGRGSPDAEGLTAALSAMSLVVGRRYLLADGIEKWGRRQAEMVIGAIGTLDEATCLVLISRGKVPAGLAEAVSSVGGEVRNFEAPAGRELPPHLVEEAARRGFELDPEAARFLVTHLGDSPTRLGNELDRLALWAGEGGRVEVEDLEEMVADLTETSVFALGDALVSGDRRGALTMSSRLLAQGKAPTSLVYPTAAAVRRAHRAVSMLEAGEPPKAVEKAIDLPPFLVRRLIESVRGASPDALRTASIALADLELWTRGGSDYPDELALEMALVAATADA